MSKDKSVVGEREELYVQLLVEHDASTCTGFLTVDKLFLLDVGFRHNPMGMVHFS
jgi:hypothetical protein